MDFKKIEKKWQSQWGKKKIFQVKKKSKNKMYVLEMFPYPSGSGLHMGHAFNYSIGDIYARYKRMQGFNVLYPMGYASFGLPAENAAIQANDHPRRFTENSIKNFIKQQKDLGLSYDWNRMIKTSDPEYYKWNQYFFLQFLKNGLVYRKKASVNWCPKCSTVLANEQVHNGKCWRHTTLDVEVKQLEQWFIKTTKYADELLKDIERLDWPERIKIMQRNWIGKSQGTEINFNINGKNWPIFTTRPDTIFGVTFMVISAQHPRLMELVAEKQKKQVENFLKKLKSTKQEDLDKLEKEGVFTGSYALHPLTKEKIPIWVGNFVLADYGSGMVMAVPAHDQRDFEFAKKYKIPIKQVIARKNSNCIIIHGCPSKDENNPLKRTYDKHWIPWTKNQLSSCGIKTETPLMPTPWEADYKEWKKEFEKNKITENTILIGHSCGSAFLVRWLGDTKQRINKLILVAPWKIAEKNNSKKKAFYDYPIDETIKSRVDEIIIFTSNDEEKDGKKSAKIFEKALSARLMELKDKGHYMIGDMGTEEFPELIKEIIEEKEAYVNPGVLINSKEFNGLYSEEAKEKITKELESKNLGKKTTEYKLRDWLISRQRYWGTPIPIIYCEKCGIIPVPEKNLPVKLPEKIKFGTGNPLESNKKFLNVKCPKCNSNAKRETDTMDTFFDSSWYFLRYIDNKNKKMPFDKKKISNWMPVDQYIGGAEHACMHLIYARFFTKALRDLGYLKFNEPFTKLFNQGMLHGNDGYVMSKSRGNVVLPEEVSKKYGIDTARLFLMSIASPDKDLQWSDKGIEGSSRFINNVISYFNQYKPKEKLDKKLEHKMNKTIKLVTEYIEEFKYNLAIIQIREFFDGLPKNSDKKSVEVFLKLLSPFCPHISEELWHKIGKKTFISLELWPKYDFKKINEEFEKQEELQELLLKDIRTVADLIKDKHPKKLFIYVIPKELSIYESFLDKIIGYETKIFSLSDKRIYDPQNKSKKAKSGKPAIYLE